MDRYICDIVRKWKNVMLLYGLLSVITHIHIHIGLLKCT